MRCRPRSQHLQSSSSSSADSSSSSSTTDDSSYLEPVKTLNAQMSLLMSRSASGGAKTKLKILKRDSSANSQHAQHAQQHQHAELGEETEQTTTTTNNNINMNSNNNNTSNPPRIVKRSDSTQLSSSSSSAVASSTLPPSLSSPSSSPPVAASASPPTSTASPYSSPTAVPCSESVRVYQPMEVYVLSAIMFLFYQYREPGRIRPFCGEEEEEEEEELQMNTDHLLRRWQRRKKPVQHKICNRRRRPLPHFNDLLPPSPISYQNNPHRAWSIYNFDEKWIKFPSFWPKWAQDHGGRILSLDTAQWTRFMLPVPFDTIEEEIVCYWLPRENRLRVCYLPQVKLHEKRKKFVIGGGVLFGQICRLTMRLLDLPRDFIVQQYRIPLNGFLPAQVKFAQIELMKQPAMLWNSVFADGATVHVVDNAPETSARRPSLFFLNLTHDKQMPTTDYSIELQTHCNRERQRLVGANILYEHAFIIEHSIEGPEKLKGLMKKKFRIDEGEDHDCGQPGTQRMIQNYSAATPSDVELPYLPPIIVIQAHGSPHQQELYSKEIVDPNDAPKSICYPQQSILELFEQIHEMCCHHDRQQVVTVVLLACHGSQIFSGLDPCVFPSSLNVCGYSQPIAVQEHPKLVLTQLLQYQYEAQGAIERHGLARHKKNGMENIFAQLNKMGGTKVGFKYHLANVFQNISKNMKQKPKLFKMIANNQPIERTVL